MNTISHANKPLSVHDRHLNRDQRSFNLIFAAIFVLFLVFYTLARILPQRWIEQAGRSVRRRGIIAKARSEANILASYALMR